MIAPLLLALLLQTAPLATAPVSPAASSQQSQTVLDEANGVLDALHDAAARADGEAYFALYTPTGRFVGTDASEHWSLAEFRRYADPLFARGRGWTYHPRDRVLTVADGVVVFDEKLDHASYGELRGSGVLVRDANGGLKVQQYVLSFTVPNDKAAAVVEVIRAPAPAAD